MRNLSIYIHIPFCVKKCLYCDFLSFPITGEPDAYIALLLKEIKEQSLLYKNHKVISVFVGGGTPSVLKEGQIAAIMEQIFACYQVEESAEVTIEMNPGTVTAGKLREYITSGINRISIGLQSADDGELKRIGRIHDYETFLETYHLARETGFDNINVDLMAALPGQSEASYQRSLACVAALAPEHISAYSLILEEGTPLHERQKNYTFPTEEEERRMYHMTRRYLEEQGYHRYEISNYAKEGCECRHNKVYWQRGDYVGFGLGAASMVAECRWSNPKDFKRYEDYINNMRYTKDGNRNQSVHSVAPERQYLTVPDQMEEFMFLGLRMMCGVSFSVFYRKFGQRMDEVYGNVIRKFCAQGLLAQNGDFLCLTEQGIDVSNYIMSEFLF